MRHSIKSVGLVVGVVLIPVGLLIAFWARPSIFDFNASGRRAAIAEAELAPEKQKQIWDNEHMAFEIERRFGPAFLAALLSKDATRLQAFMLPEFRGSDFTDVPVVPRRKDFISETRQTAPAGSATTIDSLALSASLIKLLEPFDKIQRKQIRNLQIAPIEGQPFRWRARVLLGFQGLNASGHQVSAASEHEVELTVPDEMQMDSTAIINSWQMETAFSQVCQQPFFEEVTESYGLDRVAIGDNWKLPLQETSQNRFQIACADYNQDGYLDIAVALLDGTTLLLQSVEGKRFQEVAHSLGINGAPRPALNFVAGWIDYNNDGYPDLLSCGRLYENRAGQSFVDVTDRSGLQFAEECMGCNVADYDGDGFVDLYLVYQREFGSSSGAGQDKPRWVDDEHSGKANELWRNMGNGTFRNVTAVANAGGGKRHTHSAAWLYYDDDAYPDLFLTNDFGKNVLLRNKGDGSFEDISSGTGADGFATSMGAVTGDIDNDGLTDIYVANMFSKMGRRIIGQLTDSDYPPGIFPQIQGSCAGNQLFLRKDGKLYLDCSNQMGVNAVGWAYAPAMFDVDGDGWLDLYATAGFMSFEKDEPDG